MLYHGAFVFKAGESPVPTKQSLPTISVRNMNHEVFTFKNHT